MGEWVGGGKQGRVSRTFVPGPGFQVHLLSLAPEYLVSSSPGVSMEKCGLLESTGPGVLKESIQPSPPPISCFPKQVFLL